MSGLKILYNLILKDTVKRSGSASGILSIGKDVRKLADKKFQRYVKSAQNQGVDLDKLSEQEAKYMLELNKPKEPVVLSNEDAYAFLNQFLNQGKGKSEIIKFPKDKIKDINKAKSRPPKTEIIGGIQTTRGLGDLFPQQVEKTVTVRTVIEDIKKLDPMDSMKETNRVLRGEGKYKNLSKADREKIAGDESVTDHIFERNIEPDPEDFAYGGVAGMLGERTGYQEGKTAKKSFIKLIPQYDEKGNLIPVFSKTGKQQIEGAPEGITSDKEVFNLIVGLDIPITEKINILGDIGFSKYRDRIEKDDQELFLMDPASNVNKNIGIGYEDNGLSGSIMYNPDTKYKQFQISKKFNEGGRVPYSKGSSSEVLPPDFDELDHDELMHIIKLLQAGEIPKFADGGRIGFKLGGIDKARRLFLQAMGAGAAGIGAAKTGLFGLLKSSKPVTKELTSVPIKNIEGMPAWFKPLVNKVIKEGTEVSSGAERVIVHRTKLPNSKTDVHVIQELDTGHIMVDIGKGKHGFADGHLGQPVSLEYRASELIEPTINTKTGKVIHKGQKTKPEFNVEEAEFTGGHPENIKFEESTINKFGEHGSNFDEVEMFATGKVKKSKPTKKAERTEWESGKAEADAEAAADMADDFASGGLARMLGE